MFISLVCQIYLVLFYNINQDRFLIKAYLKNLLILKKKNFILLLKYYNMAIKFRLLLSTNLYQITLIILYI